ncbi:hypothetical protein R1X32_10765 (plasmid) [Rhodococcus opacus]|uniref:hypothetical protein n=1 Tax=Rhodococcus opacus TaxID=37919 RepID=UPI0034D2D167
MSARRGRVVPVDLAMLGSALESDLGMSPGGFADLCTGDVEDESSADPMRAGQDTADDVPVLPDRRLRFDRTGSRDGWRDMRAFSRRRRDTAPRQRLEGHVRPIPRPRPPGASPTRGTPSPPTVNWVVRARKFLADECILVG